jgi:hypothetical protein
MPCCRRLIATAALAGAAAGAGAAPVDGAAVAADPHELAVRWTLASLSPLDLPSAVNAPAGPAPTPMARLSGPPHGAASGGVPDPAGYALMGLLLLGGGLLAQRLTAARARGPRRR